MENLMEFKTVKTESTKACKEQILKLKEMKKYIDMKQKELTESDLQRQGE